MAQTTSQFRHDLRTPLNHLIGYGEILTETLSDEGAGSEAVSEALKEAIRSARDLVNAIQTLPLESLPEAVEKAGLARVLEPAEPLLDGPHAEDLRRMQSAARQLSQLVTEGAGEPVASPGPKEEAPIERDAASGNLLAVDDNEQNRELLVRMLNPQGFRVTAAASGDECLALLEKEDFDLVLLDVMMPGMSGFDVLSRMRENGKLATTPVIVISALDESSAAIRCINMGAEDYLPKPFDPVLLRARIGATLEKKRLRDQEARYARDLESALGELRGAKDKLVVQEKLASLGALTAGIAHELKNPLNFITNFSSVSREILTELAEAIREGSDTADLLQTLKENLERVETHGKRADRIVRGMLLHSYSQPGKREPADINSIVEEAMSLAYHGMRAQDSTFNISIGKQMAAGLPPIPVVAQDISRVLVNILNNAFYATEEKKKTAGDDYAPRILASTRDTGNAVEIVLEDNGVGIPDAVAKKIFDPFFTTKPAGSGTGLGLSISYDIIVRTHEGALNLESAPGEFTRFHIVLPKGARA